MATSNRSTNKELVEELQARNVDGRYDILIANARNNHYHDYKAPGDIVCGKMKFIEDSVAFEDLADVRQQIMDGYYDEKPDAADIKSMREDLIMDNATDAMFTTMGFEVPTAQERAFVKARAKFSKS